MKILKYFFLLVLSIICIHFNSSIFTMEDDENKVEIMEIDQAKSSKRKREDSDESFSLKKQKIEYFDALPDEIIIFIFSFAIPDVDDLKAIVETILNIKLVNKRWSNIIADETLMKLISRNYLEAIFKHNKVKLAYHNEETEKKLVEANDDIIRKLHETWKKLIAKRSDYSFRKSFSLPIFYTGFNWKLRKLILFPDIHKSEVIKEQLPKIEQTIEKLEKSKWNEAFSFIFYNIIKELKLVDRRDSTSHYSDLKTNIISIYNKFGDKQDYLLLSLKGDLENEELEKQAAKISNFIVNKRGDTALMIASHKGNAQVVECLLKAGANVNSKNNDGWTALMMFCDSAFEFNDVLELFIKFGADVNTQNIDGETALMFLCQPMTCIRHYEPAIEDRSWMVSTLIGSGALVNIKNNKQQTALLLAAQYAIPTILQVLLEAGADINEKDKRGRTPLMLAAKNGIHQNVQILLEAGADINARCENGYTPLMYACLNNPISLKTIKYILKTDDKTLLAKDSKGNTALEILAKSNTEELSSESDDDRLEG